MSGKHKTRTKEVTWTEGREILLSGIKELTGVEDTFDEFYVQDRLLRMRLKDSKLYATVPCRKLDGYALHKALFALYGAHQSRLAEDRIRAVINAALESKD